MSFVGLFLLIYFIIDFQVTAQGDGCEIHNSETHQNIAHGVLHKRTVVFKYLRTSGTLYGPLKNTKNRKYSLKYGNTRKNLAWKI